MINTYKFRSIHTYTCLNIIILIVKVKFNRLQNNNYIATIAKSIYICCTCIAVLGYRGGAMLRSPANI